MKTGIAQTGPASEGDKLHKVANSQFVPFVVSFLRGEKIPEGAVSLPLAKPEAMTKEAVEAVKDCCNQAALEWLCRGSGWKQRWVAHPRWEHPALVRIWDAPSWKSYEQVFTTKSLSLLLAAFRYTRVTATPEKGSADAPVFGHSSKPKPERKASYKAKRGFREHLQDWSWSEEDISSLATGDWIVHHLVYRELLRLGQLDKNQIRLFHKNPFSIASSFWSGGALEDQRKHQLPVAFRALFRSGFAEFLPWLGVEWAEQWVQGEKQRWSTGAQGFTRFNEVQHLLIQAWLEESIAQERHDWLVPLLHYFHELFGEEKQWQVYYDQFRTLFEEVRLSERREHQAGWSLLLKLSRQLREQFDEISQLHPVERESPHRVWLQMYETLRFENCMEQVEELIARLEPRVG